MAFYVVVKGNITNYDFKYLSDKATPRLNKTIISSEAKGVPQEQIEKLQNEVYALEIMTKKLQTLTPANKVKEAKEIMQTYNISHIPIMVDDIMTGLISNVDLDKSSRDDDEQLRLHKVMSKTVLCASESTPLRHIIEVFYHERIRCLPIVDSNMFVVGVITLKDILKWILDHKKYFND